MIRVTWNNLIPPGYQSEDIVNYLLKPSIFDNPELKDIKKSSFYEWDDRKGRKQTFYNYLLETKTNRTRLFSLTPESKSISERMLHLLLEKTNSENLPYNINSFPIRHEFKRRWMKILTPLERLSPEEIESLEIGNGGRGKLNGRIILAESDVELYRKYIDTLLKEEFSEKEIGDFIQATKRIKRDFRNVSVNLCYNNNVIPLSSLIMSIRPCTYTSASHYKDDEESTQLSIEENLFFERLASLSVIASIWYIWENADSNASYQEALIRVAKMIFPSSSLSVFNTPEQHIEVADTDAEGDDTIIANEELQKIKAALGAREYDKAGILCENVFLTYKNASDNVIAKTLSYLITCCENGYSVPRYFSSINNIIREAFNYGSSYISKEKSEIKNHPQLSQATGAGIYTINSDSSSSVCDWIINTAPPVWKKTVSDSPESTLVSNTKQRIFLVNDNYNINLRDTINILDKIKTSVSKSETKISDWKYLELFIRCNETEITPLLDTALSYFTEDNDIASQAELALVKIYLIDEAKRSANFLFAQHPHFYPLTLARNNTDGPQCIHVILATDNINLKYSEWLIKEAFWTLPRTDQNVISKISIISPHATELCHSITSQCPGLASLSLLNGKVENTELDIRAAISDINFPVIEYINTSFSSQALQTELENLWNPNEFLYYIVDSSSDTEGINLAIRIREHAIRKSVLTGHSSNYSKYNSIIAVRCFDPDISGLTRELIVPKEKEHGKQWFNDYNLITFGSIESIYSWDQLNGGIIETVSQCIHLQYCNASLDNSSCNKALTSYFKRLYNHDSSFGAAVSIPYRLYEAGVIPETWFIQNDEAWWNETVRNELGSSYKKLLEEDASLIEKLSRYEHMRWCCFQLTRGWLPVDSTRVIQYISSGVNRHVLQIAKLHPCLCSWDDLIELHRQLSVTAMRKINWSDYEQFCSFDEIKPYLDKRFSAYYSFEEDYSLFQQIDNKNIEQTDLIVKTAWDTEGTKRQDHEK